MKKIALTPGITRTHSEKEWHILGHTYWLLTDSDTSFAFESYDPPGTLVPPHVHNTQDEFIYVLEGEIELMLDGERYIAGTGDLVRMPMGVPHGVYNNSDAPARTIFWVSPGGKLRELFEKLHELEDVDEVVRLSALHDVDFLPPEA